MRPFVDRLLGTRISRPPSLPIAFDQLPPSMEAFYINMHYFKQIYTFIDYSQEYSKGLMAPLCVDLKELPSPETLHARMTSIAIENGLLGGIGEDVVNVMLFAAEVKYQYLNIYIESDE